jgi:TolB-like protein/DNA-binding SARP family transcriptional activator
MSKFKLTLLGEFKLVTDLADPVDIRSKRARALLAYLALHAGEKLGREQLAALLWSRSDDEHAGHSLRQAIAELRRAGLGGNDSPLGITTTTIGLAAEGIGTDVAEFGRLAVADATEGLEQAITLANRPFLEGLALNEPEFDDWVAEETRALETKLLEAMHKLMSLHEADQAYDACLDIARKILSRDQLQEAAHRAIMRCLDQLDRRAEAIQHYQACSETLKSELGVKPAKATVVLYHEILRNSGEELAEDSDADARLSIIGNGLAPTAPAKLTRFSKFAALATLATAVAIIGTIAIFEPQYLNPRNWSGDDGRTNSAIRRGAVIAVLPFDNMSGDPKQEYFADGITKDIITRLTEFQALGVIARNSTFQYKGMASDVRKIAEDLNASHIVEGSIRTSSDRIRVTVQLVDAADGNHLWGELYDRDLTASNVFDIQDVSVVK